MKSVRDGENLVPAGYRAGHTQRILVRFGTGIDEEHAVEPGGRSANETLCGFGAYVQSDSIALKQQTFDLLPDGVHESWMAIAERGNGMPAVQVEDPAAVRGDNVAARAVDGHKWQLSVNGNRCRRFASPGIMVRCRRQVHLQSLMSRQGRAT